MRESGQEGYWQRVRYRGPDHPVVQAYARPKLDAIERVVTLRGKSILDVGCGPGLFSVLLAERAERVVGVERSPSMLARAERRPGVEYQAGSAEQLPFADQSFDLAFEANLLHHVDSPVVVLDEMRRVAREAVILIEPNAWNPLMAGFSLLVKAERGGLRSTRRNLRRWCTAAGLNPVSLITTGLISQNNTPEFLVPILRPFDIDFPWGEYHVVVARPAAAGDSR